MICKLSFWWTNFPRGEKTKVNEQREITCHASSLSHLDPRTNQSELEVQMIIHLQDIANQIPNAFSDSR